MGILANASLGADGGKVGGDGGGEAAAGKGDIYQQGWSAVDREGKGHITAQDLRRVCLDMGYKVTERDVHNMMMVMSPTAAIAAEGEEAAAGVPTPADTSNLKRQSTPGKTQSGITATISFDRYKTTMNSAFMKKFEKGEHVFRHGDPVDGFYVITKGSCAVTVPSSDGQRNIATLQAGDFFGETGMLEGRERRAASVVCQEDVEVLSIDRAVFEQLASSSSDSKLSAAVREKAEARQRARLMKVFELLSISLHQRRAFPKGSMVYQQGDAADHFYIVNNGDLEMSVTTQDGTSVRVKRLKGGDHFGYDALLSNNHDATVTCLTDVELTVVPQSEMRLAQNSDAYLDSTVKAQHDRRSELRKKARKGEAQILPMMAAAARKSEKGSGSKTEVEQYQRMVDEMTHLELSEGEIVFRQGDTPHSVYIVSEGKLNCEREEGAAAPAAAATAAAAASSSSATCLDALPTGALRPARAIVLQVVADPNDLSRSSRNALVRHPVLDILLISRVLDTGQRRTGSTRRCTPTVCHVSGHDLVALAGGGILTP